MKKFFCNILLLSLPFIFLVIFCLFLDPYNVFHYKNICDNGIEPNKNYIKMRHILDNYASFDSYLFGSSRVAFINVADIPGLHCYNMTYSAGLPREHRENLEVMIKKNIIPAVVLMGVDDVGCYTDPKAHHNQLIRMPYPADAVQNNTVYYKFLMKYINPDILRSIPIIISHKGDNLTFRKHFYENGGAAVGLSAKTNWANVSVDSPPFHDYGIDNVIADIQSVIDLCNRNNIKLILFTNPLHILTYQQTVKNGYIDFLSRLSEITDYYNFSGINDITTNNDNYHETSHYKVETGSLIIDAIFNHKIDQKLLSQGFGYYVTSENKNEFIDFLLNQRNP